MKLRCYLLYLLRIHRPDCERCNARETCGDEMRRRLEELNWRTQPDSLNNGDHEQVVAVFDSKPDKVVASPPISLAAEKDCLKPTEPKAARTLQAFMLFD